MTPDNRLKIKNLIKKHEGLRQNVYTDTTGHLTIGYGHNLSAMGVSYPVCDTMLDDDISYWMSELSHKLSIYDDLSPARQGVLIDMCHNLGVQGVLNFKDMLEAIQTGDYNKAADAMLESKWSQQVGQRAIQDAYIMRTGDL